MVVNFSDHDFQYDHLGKVYNVGVPDDDEIQSLADNGNIVKDVKARVRHMEKIIMMNKDDDVFVALPDNCLYRTLLIAEILLGDIDIDGFLVYMNNDWFGIPISD